MERDSLGEDVLAIERSGIATVCYPRERWRALTFSDANMIISGVVVVCDHVAEDEDVY